MNSILVFKNETNIKKYDLSIVIPTFRNKQLLFSAIDSVIALERYEGISYELLVVNNNPDDDMQELVDKYKKVSIPISLYKNIENYGQVGNINQGVYLSRGKYVAFLHDDDLLLPNYLNEIGPFIISGQEYDCIVASFYMMAENYSVDFKHRFLDVITSYRYLYRKKIQEITPKDYINSFYDVYSAPTCGTLFLKKAILDYGYFKDAHGAAWDYYNYRMFNKEKSVFLLHRYIGIRRTESGMSNEAKIQKEFLEDRKSMVQFEIGDNKFIEKYNPTFFTKKPLIKYIIFRIRTRLYYYSHNLDSTIGIPKKLFRIYHNLDKN